MGKPMIKFLDLKAVNEQYRPEIDAAIKRVLDSGWYLLGEEGAAFEREFADYCRGGLLSWGCKRVGRFGFNSYGLSGVGPHE